MGTNCQCRPACLRKRKNDHDTILVTPSGVADLPDLSGWSSQDCKIAPRPVPGDQVLNHPDQGESDRLDFSRIQPAADMRRDQVAAHGIELPFQSHDPCPSGAGRGVAQVPQRKDPLIRGRELLLLQLPQHIGIYKFTQLLLVLKVCVARLR